MKDLFQQLMTFYLILLYVVNKTLMSVLFKLTTVIWISNVTTFLVHSLALTTVPVATQKFVKAIV